mmetsp:Transcript_47279/g.107789  ORF Transcript_47279/g.107789 Transcript_47279/m.107789 type:complete len:299 (+) Transcript_47279:209-1105(+)
MVFLARRWKAFLDLGKGEGVCDRERFSLPVRRVFRLKVDCVGVLSPDHSPHLDRWVERTSQAVGRDAEVAAVEVEGQFSDVQVQHYSHNVPLLARRAPILQRPPRSFHLLAVLEAKAHSVFRITPAPHREPPLGDEGYVLPRHPDAVPALSMYGEFGECYLPVVSPSCVGVFRAHQPVAWPHCQIVAAHCAPVVGHRDPRALIIAAPRVDILRAASRAPSRLADRAPDLGLGGLGVGDPLVNVRYAQPFGVLDNLSGFLGLVCCHCLQSRVLDISGGGQRRPHALQEADCLGERARVH